MKLTQDEIILGQAAVIAKLNHEIEELKKNVSNLYDREYQSNRVIDAYVWKFGPELREETLSVPF